MISQAIVCPPLHRAKHRAKKARLVLKDRSAKNVENVRVRMTSYMVQNYN